MTVLYADTSALVRAYFVDEDDHGRLRRTLLESDRAVLTSEIARTELASAVRAAFGAGRVSDAATVLARIDADCAEDGPIALVKLVPERILPAAYRLVVGHRLRTLDAIHIAVALDDAARFAGDGQVVLVTRDERQAAAAAELGLEVR